MNEQELLSAIEQYRCSDMDRAILLDGAWGSGKTYFVLKHLEKRQKHIYVSAFGLKDSSEIDKAILIGIPEDALDNGKRSLKEKTRRNLAKIPNAAKEILKQISISGIKLPDSLFDASTIVSLSTAALKNCLIIIDDIERSTIPLSELLGKINIYTEQYGLKVMLVANTNEIIGNDAKLFKKYRDKIIREELSFKQDYHSILLESMSKISNSAVREDIKERIPLMLDFISSFEISNVRQIQTAIEKTAAIIEILQAHSSYQSEPEYGKLISDITIFSLYDSANLDDYQIEAYQDIQSIRLTAKHGEPWDLRYFSFVKDYGVLEIRSTSKQIAALLDKHLKTLIDSRQASSDPIMQLYNKCLYLEDNDIISYEKSIIKKLETGKYGYENYPRLILVLIRAKNLLGDSSFLKTAQDYLYSHLSDIDNEDYDFINLATLTFYSTAEADEYRAIIGDFEKDLKLFQNTVSFIKITKALESKEWSAKLKEFAIQKEAKIVAQGQFLSRINYNKIIDNLSANSAKTIDFRNLQEAFATIYDRPQNELASFKESDYASLKVFSEYTLKIQPQSRTATQALNDLRANLKTYIEALE